MRTSKRLFTVWTLITAILLFACSTFTPQATEPEVTIAPEVGTSQESAPTIESPPPTDEPTEAPPTETPSVDQEALMEIWKPAIGSHILLTGVCETLQETVDNQLGSESSSSGLFGEIFAARLFLGIIEEAIGDWTPSDEVASHKDEIQAHLDALQTTLSDWGDDLLTKEQASEQVGSECDAAMSEFEAMAKEASSKGLSEASLETIVTEIQSIFEDMQSETEEEVVQIPEGIGMSRQNPFPYGELGSAPNWDIQVTEVLRGEPAWSLIQQANPFNEPAPEGAEYVLVKVKALSTAADSEEHSISSWDFDLTGSNLVQYSSASVVLPDPVLEASLYSGGEAEGWLAFMVGQAEDNLILILDESANWEEDRYRFFALEDGAMVEVPAELSTILPNELGVDRSSPAPFGEKVITQDWEVQVMDVLRGEAAWAKIQEANQFNDPPQEGMEYVLALIRARFVGQALNSQSIDSYAYETTGSENVLYDLPSVVAPEPTLNAYLFPGGEYTGWVALSAAEGEENLMLVFQPFMDWDETNKRFLSLEP